MTPMEQKAALRLQLKKDRDALPQQDTLLWDAAIARQVMASPWFRQADIVFAYCSVGREVDTSTIVKAALQMNKRVAFPRCGQPGQMSFYLVESTADLTEGKYGIPQPAPHCAAAAATQRSLCLVPGLAFDRQGYRIGYGGGYYDRFLAGFSGKSLGLVRQCFLTETLPHTNFDLPVQGVVTQKALTIL